MQFKALPILFVALAFPAGAQPVADPPAGFYEAGEAPDHRPAAETVASGASVVSAPDPRGADAGLAMLRAGGNAADAAVAILLTLTVAEPQSSGIGGGGYLLWFDAESGKTITIDARETAPAAARPDRFLRENGEPLPYMDAVAGGYSVGVPGAVALAAELHRRWGRLEWKKLFEPAIALARDGITITERGHAMIAARRDMLAASPAAAIFLDTQGRPWPVGHVLRQPELAQTLETLAREGPDAFYRGPIGAAVSEAVANAFARPAALTAADLAAYRTNEQPPLCRPYRQWRVCSMGPSSAGGIAVLQILGQLERFNLPMLGPDNLFSWHLVAESQRLAYADRAAWGADAAYAPVPVEGLLSDAYIQQRSRLIRVDRAMPVAEAGTPPGAAKARMQRLADIPATSHFVTADTAGNVASLTSTIEGIFGSGLVAGGFLLNNQLTDFDMTPRRTDGQDAWNRVEPGKRPRSSMSPTIVYDAGGKPVAAFGAAGGATIIAQVAKMIIAHLDWNMPVEQAIAAPQLVADQRGVRLEQGTRLETMAAGLQALGHQKVRVTTLPLKGNGVARAGTQWRAAADPRGEGVGRALKAPATTATGTEAGQ